MNSEVLFANYVKRLGPECEKLQDVEIVDPPMYNHLQRIYFPSPTGKFAKITDVCQAKPQMRVEYRISEFKYGIATRHRCVFCPSTIIIKGILYNLALPGRDLTFLINTGTSRV
ncbi:hypothetical protein BS50DRAFT_592967 [Corynespora cassiicola Philippines]|uniref:Uncharacterized protein n=1 Tax=Corynespora cassiicola Philippines TaxID=1448308 RepID=A0A2T2N7W6_CORCC|nr:hypothetical protein BS50DRAFT_592967 [Corynespora cassiicola Philippines]